MNLVSKEIETYCKAHSSPLSPLFLSLMETTHAQTELPQMMVGQLEGNFLRLLVRLSGARRILEIGTFTGFSSLAMAEGLPDDGQLITCDINPESTAIAQDFWKKHPQGHKIQLHLGPALETIATLQEPLDLVFIDADKTNYLNYWNACLPLLKPGGLLVVDNVLWSGRVLNPENESDHAIVAFNQAAAQDPRVESVMLSIRDGMLLAWKNL